MSGFQSRAARSAALVIRTGGFEGVRYDLGRNETVIGRSPATDITLLDEGISREHAMVHFDESADAFVIEDLHSTNGTQVNGKRRRSAVLTPGDEVRIGYTVFEFVLG